MSCTYCILVFIVARTIVAHNVILSPGEYLLARGATKGCYCSVGLYRPSVVREYGAFFRYEIVKRGIVN